MNSRKSISIVNDLVAAAERAGVSATVPVLQNLAARVSSGDVASVRAILGRDEKLARVFTEFCKENGVESAVGLTPLINEYFEVSAQDAAWQASREGQAAAAAEAQRHQNHLRGLIAA